MPAENLAATIGEIKSLSGAGSPDRFGRDDFACALDAPPYIALGPVKPWIVHTDGGLRIDSRFRVLRPDGSPIDGLYAAGSAGQGGLVLWGHGLHIAWAFTSGRLADLSAASELPAAEQPAG